MARGKRPRGSVGAASVSSSMAPRTPVEPQVEDQEPPCMVLECLGNLCLSDLRLLVENSGNVLILVGV